MTNRKKILYIDDEIANLTSFKYLFQDEFEIFTAESGKIGLEIFGKEDIELILCDQRMPEMTGSEVLEKIYNINPDVIRIILTGYSDYTAVIDAINKGHIYNYIEKPWSEPKLRLQIRNALKAGEITALNTKLSAELSNKNAELIENIEKIKKSEHEIIQLNLGLEERVQKRTAQLEQMQQGLLDILSNSPVGLAVTQIGDGSIVFCNDRLAEMFEKTPEEMIGLVGRDLMIQEEVEYLLNELEEEGYYTNQEVTVPRFENDNIEAIMSTFPITFEGKEARLTWIVDITPLKKIQRNLSLAKISAEQANSSKSTFLATMSHEIRTPMNGVVGLIDLLYESPLNDDQREMVNTTRNSTYALLRIVDDILDFSKMEAGKLEIEELKCDLREIVEGVGETLAGNASLRSLELNTYIDPDIPKYIISDGLRIRQILLNLAGNALKFTETTKQKKGCVRIEATLNSEKTTKEGEPFIQFSIFDNGIGIAKHKQKELFQPFHQLEASTTREYGGTGLGLAICVSLTELLKGEISVKSEQGEGTEFILNLPLKSEDDNESADQALDKLRGLILDDDVIFSKTVVSYLAQAGCEVEVERDIDNVRQKIASSCETDTPYDFLVISSTDKLNEVFRVIMKCAEDFNWDLNRCIVIQSRSEWSQKIENSDIKYVHGNPMKQTDLIRAVGIATGKIKISDGQKMVTFDKLPKVKKNISRDIEREAGRLILVAEDNITNQDVIRRQLTRLGFAADIVNNGMEAFEALEKEQYGLLLTDCHMPMLDGYGLAKIIRESEGNTSHRIPIIALTANALKTETDRCYECGMDSVLIKPVEISNLYKVIDQWLPSNNLDENHEIEDTTISVLSGNEAGKGNVIDYDHVANILGTEDKNEINSLLVMFWETVEGVSGDFESLYNKKDNEALREAAHSAKGAALYAGALPLSDILKSIETSANNKEWDKIENLLPELNGALKSVEEFISSINS